MEVEDRGAALWATITRPHALNAVDEDVLDHLESALDRVDDDPTRRAMCVTGSGRAFSVGLDIDCLDRGFGDHGYFRHLLGRFNHVLGRIEACPVPVIAAVNGLARAGGFEIVLAADLAIAADEARIGDNHLQFGVMPGGGATQRAAQRLGPMRAKELIFTSRWLDATEATALGLVLDHVPRAELLAAVDGLVAQIADKPRGVLAATKRAIRDGRDLPLDAGVACETATFFDYLDTDPAASAGFFAFLDQRRARRPGPDEKSRR
ncbi:MAG: enoyl-CoA hydratase/isomerase family protein [Acidimicrobiales bacterium]